MANLSVEIDVSKAVAALQKLSGPDMDRKLSAALTETALFGERTVVGFTPVDTGALRGSIQANRLGPLGWKISSGLTYVVPVEMGSKPHVIRPRSGKFLRFPGSGGMVYARSVRHPGSRARKMFARSVPKIQSELQRIVGRILGR